MAGRKLTPKQERFCEEYLVDLNGTQAVIRAGYSKKGASVTGSNLLGNIRIQRELMRLRSRLTDRVEVSQDWVLAKLVENHARASQVIEVVDRDGNGIGEYKYEGNVANRALELLGKHLGMFTERHHHIVEDNTGVLAVTPEQSDEAWEAEFGSPVENSEAEAEAKNGAVN